MVCTKYLHSQSNPKDKVIPKLNVDSEITTLQSRFFMVVHFYYLFVIKCCYLVSWRDILGYIKEIVSLIVNLKFHSSLLTLGKIITKSPLYPSGASEVFF